MQIIIFDLQTVKSTNMIEDYFRIKDTCRKGLLKYLSEACSNISMVENPAILDIGCGTGVPTLWLAGSFKGSILAIDTNVDALESLNRKMKGRKLKSSIRVMPVSFFDLKPEPGTFDLILAEGFLNVVGFEKGFPEVIRLLKKNGYFIIHDEYRDHDKKCEFIRLNKCNLEGTIYLDEKIWWDCYYACLKAEIDELKPDIPRELFKSDLDEINYYRKDPSQFRSIYYIVHKL